MLADDVNLREIVQMCGSELKVLPEGVRRVAALLQERGHPHSPVMLGDAARTAQERFWKT